MAWKAVIGLAVHSWSAVSAGNSAWVQAARVRFATRLQNAEACLCMTGKLLWTSAAVSYAARMGAALLALAGRRTIRTVIFIRIIVSQKGSLFAEQPGGAVATVSGSAAEVVQRVVKHPTLHIIATRAIDALIEATVVSAIGPVSAQVGWAKIQAAVPGTGLFPANEVRATANAILITLDPRVALSATAPAPIITALFRDAGRIAWCNEAGLGPTFNRRFKPGEVRKGHALR